MDVSNRILSKTGYAINILVGGYFGSQTDVISVGDADSGGTGEARVGILTANPAATLDINGSFKSSSAFLSSSGTVTAGAALDARGLSLFGENGGDIYVTGNSLNCQYNTNAEGYFNLNYGGYHGGTSQFRSINIYDGKNALIARFVGNQAALVVGGTQAATGMILDVQGAARIATLRLYTGAGVGKVPISDAEGNLTLTTPPWSTTTGTVTAVSVVSANGLAGSSSGGATPALTLSCSVTGLLKCDGTTISSASAGTDYASPSQTFYLGTTSIAINRASASIALTGITSIDGSAASATKATNIAGGLGGGIPYQTAAATTTFLALGTSGYVLTAGASAPTYVAQSTLSVGTSAACSGNAATATILATGRNIAGVSFNGSADIAIPLANLSTVSAASPIIDNILRFDGTNWVASSAATASASAGIEFFPDTTDIIVSGTQNDIVIETLNKYPVTTTESVEALSCANNTVVTSAYLYNSAMGRTTLDAGIWGFDFYASVSSTSAGRVSTITNQIYKVSPYTSPTVTITGTGTSRTCTAASGTPFATANIDASATNTTASFVQTPKGLYQITARTSDTVVTILVPSGYTNESAVAFSVWKKLFGVTSPTITNLTTNYGLYSTSSAQAAFTVLATDKMGMLVFGTSNNTTTVNYVYNGTTHYSHFSTPLVTLHNNLSGLQGGTSNEYYHQTSAEYTGTGTGVFVRTSGGTLTNPKLDNTIYDPNGNAIIATATIANAVNFITLNNNTTGNDIAVSASGTDANINLVLNSKGTGSIKTSGRTLPTITTVSDGAGYVCNLALGNEFRITIAADRLAGTTTNYVDGQWWTLEITASGGARTPTFPTSSTGDFAGGSDLPLSGITAIASGKTDVFLWEYRSATNRNELRAYIKGF